MAKVAILLADGFETIEALAPADVLRRAGEDVSLVTINALPARHDGSRHRHRLRTATLDEYDFGACDLIVLPGGMPARRTLRANERVCELTRQFMSEKRLGAICAAPSILAELGLLDGRVATCYPGCEGAFPAGVRPEELGVYTDDNLVTASRPRLCRRLWPGAARASRGCRGGPAHCRGNARGEVAHGRCLTFPRAWAGSSWQAAPPGACSFCERRGLTRRSCRRTSMRRPCPGEEGLRPRG